MKNNLVVNRYPEIIKQWDYDKNKHLNLNEITIGSEKTAWWKCENGHNWESTIKDKIRTHCPYCSNKRILIGYNDLWTTHPHIAKFLYNKEDGYKYTYGSGKKALFKCIFCNKTIGEKIIKNAVAKGVRCPVCQYTHSLAERVMISVLNQLDISFKTEKTFKWSEGRRYDFYIPSMNMIIETHGEQHYKKSFNNGRSLEEEKENDRVKQSLAESNNIEKYIIIDCNSSDFNYIKNNIINSSLTNYFDFSKIDWKQIFIDSNTPMVLRVCRLYESENITQKEIAYKLGISAHSVLRYLKTASKNGLCDYKPNSKRNKEISINHMKKPVVQLTMGGEFINEFNSITEASKYIGNKSMTSISRCCNETLNQSKGFKWMFKEDYYRNN